MGGVVKSRERQARADSAPVSTGFRQPKNTELGLREEYMLCARRELKQKFRLTNQTRSHAALTKHRDLSSTTSDSIHRRSEMPARCSAGTLVGLSAMSLWGCGGGSGGSSAPLTNPVPMIAAISPNAATRGQPESYRAAFEDESFHVAPPQRSSAFTLK